MWVNALKANTQKCKIQIITSQTWNKFFFLYLFLGMFLNFIWKMSSIVLVFLKCVHFNICAVFIVAFECINGFSYHCLRYLMLSTDAFEIEQHTQTSTWICYKVVTKIIAWIRLLNTIISVTTQMANFEVFHNQTKTIRHHLEQSKIRETTDRHNTYTYWEGDERI